MLGGAARPGGGICWNAAPLMAEFKRQRNYPACRGFRLKAHASSRNARGGSLREQLGHEFAVKHGLVGFDLGGIERRYQGRRAVFRLHRDVVELGEQI